MGFEPATSCLCTCVTHQSCVLFGDFPQMQLNSTIQLTLSTEYSNIYIQYASEFFFHTVARNRDNAV